MNKVIFFNPRSGRYNHRIPNSILQVAASIHGKYDYVVVDGNMEKDPWKKIKEYLKQDFFQYFCSTVMPGPQLKQAIPFTKKLKEEHPGITTIWGGYFPSNQPKSSISADYVDYIVYGPGDTAFPKLLDALENNQPIDGIENLIFRREREMVKTHKAPLIDQDTLPELPYDYFNEFYPMKNYLGKTFLGEKTHAYHSSLGCPFTCSFCGVVPIYQARWRGKSPERMYREIKYVKDKYGVDSVEFHDNNFFVSEKRTKEFSRLIKDENIQWWGESRIDTMDKYDDETLALMREAGCRMIFFGAESGNDELLSKMDKGGKQNGQQIKDFAARIQKFDIIPEYSFVLGFPAETKRKVEQQVDQDINFIKEVKEINPATEIIIYVYSPVPTEDSELYQQGKDMGFKFPEHLEDWLEPEWEKFDLHRNPLTPWLTRKAVKKIHDFETVINGYSPTVSDYKLSKLQRKVISSISSIRYKKNLFAFPYEIKALQRFWLRYRKPDVEGFAMDS